MGERTRELAILVFGDSVLFVSVLWLTLLLRYLEWPSWALFADHLPAFLWLSGLWIFVFYISGLYDKQTLFLKNLLFSRLVHALVINSALALVIFSSFSLEVAPKTNLFIYLVISLLLFSVWRQYAYRFVSPKTKHRALLIASGPEVVELVDEINNNDRYTYSFVRIIEPSSMLKTIDFEQRLIDLIEREKISIVVANPADSDIAAVMPKLFDLSFVRFQLLFLDFSKIYEDTFDRVPNTAVNYQWFIHNISQSRKLIYDNLKRALDLLAALVLLLPALPLCLLIAMALKLEGRGPVFSLEHRVGQFNKPIRLYKFRTRKESSQSLIETEIASSNPEDIKFGSVLRRFHIDDLPQLLNVIVGDLSFVGPRPEALDWVEASAARLPYYLARFYIKPGLTGWAQINQTLSVENDRDTRKINEFFYDLYYLARRSFFLDLQIILKTISSLLRKILPV